jgi:folate-binding protein YgfZ
MSGLPAYSVARLDLGLLAISGTDAARFLNAQLSQRVPSADSPAPRLTAWHDPQGRVRCLCRALWDGGTGYGLVLGSAGLAGLLEQLQRYALRAAVRFELPGTHWRAVALLRAPGKIEVGRNDADLSWAAAPPHVIAVPVGPDLAHWYGPSDAIAAALKDARVQDSQAATLAEIRLGLPELRYWPEPVYVGQMLNLDRLGAIGFDKGCYPGQEVLTRVQRRGTVKRRLYRFAGAGPRPPAVGVEIFDPAGGAAGEVLRSAPADGGFEALAVVRDECRDQALECADLPGVPLSRLPLPTDLAE